MGLLVKIIGEQKVSLSVGKHVKNGQNKLHTDIVELLKGNTDEFYYIWHVWTMEWER